MVSESAPAVSVNWFSSVALKTISELRHDLERYGGVNNDA